MSLPFLADTIKNDFRSLQLFKPLGQRASITNAAQNGVLNLSGDFTMEAWVKVREESTIDVFDAIISKWSVSGGYSYFFGLYHPGGPYSLSAYISGNGTITENIGYTFTPLPGVWYHLAITYNSAAAIATEIEFFVNGVSVGNGVAETSDTGVSTLFNSTSAFVIGGDDNTISHFNGWIDDVRIWNDIRTAAEIRDNAFTELVGNEANLVGYWKFNGDLLDSTANANHLTAAGTVLPVFKKDGGIDI